MRKYAIGSAALIAVAAYGAASLARSTPGAKSIAKPSATTIHFIGTERAVIFSSGPGFPRPRKLPSQLVQVALATAKAGTQTAHGVDVNYSTITGHPSRNTYTDTGHGVSYDVNGTNRYVWSGTYTIKANGKIDDRIYGHFTGGTGLYRGITGTYTYTGSNNPHGRFWIYSGPGTIVLP